MYAPSGILVVGMNWKPMKTSDNLSTNGFNMNFIRMNISTEYIAQINGLWRGIITIHLDRKFQAHLYCKQTNTESNWRTNTQTCHLETSGECWEKCGETPMRIQKMFIMKYANYWNASSSYAHQLLHKINVELYIQEQYIVPTWVWIFCLQSIFSCFNIYEITPSHVQ